MLRRSTGQRRFSDYFGISKGQSQLDFVDVPLDTDIELYVDPYALHVSPVDWLRSCGDLVANYFDVLIQALKAKDHTRAMSLISNLHEPNETRLGSPRANLAGVAGDRCRQNSSMTVSAAARLCPAENFRISGILSSWCPE